MAAMQVEVYGGIDLIQNGRRVEAVDFGGIMDLKELLAKLPTKPIYGENWTFGGDVPFEECDILLAAPERMCFDGVDAVAKLRRALCNIRDGYPAWRGICSLGDVMIN